jgi:hypothetical protein
LTIDGGSLSSNPRRLEQRSGHLRETDRLSRQIVRLMNLGPGREFVDMKPKRRQRRFVLACRSDVAV